MAIRVNVPEVKEIIDLDDSITNAQIQAFIIVANRVVEDQLIGEGINVDTLKEIERWLTAHFLTVRDPRLKSSRIGDSKDEYAMSKLGSNLDGSMYGQQVKMLDSSNTLANIGKKKAYLETLI